MSFVESIHTFNRRAGLLEKPYDDFLESSFQVEEALEGFDLNTYEDIFPEKFPAGSNPGAKEVSRHIVDMALNSGNEEISDVDRLDKACDAVVFAIGSMAKLGLTPQQIHKAMEIVTDANLQKLSMPKDEHGKLTKPKDFVGPEERLQELLDRR